MLTVITNNSSAFIDNGGNTSRLLRLHFDVAYDSRICPGVRQCAPDSAGGYVHDIAKIMAAEPKRKSDAGLGL